MLFKLTYICSVNNRGVCHVRAGSRGVEDKASQGRSKEGPSPPHAGEHAKSGGEEGELEHFHLGRGIVSTFWGESVPAGLTNMEDVTAGQAEREMPNMTQTIVYDQKS